MTYEQLVDGLKGEQVEKIELIRGLYSVESRADIDTALNALKANKHVPFFRVLDYFHQLSHRDPPSTLYRKVVNMRIDCDGAEAVAVDEAVRDLRADVLGLESRLSTHLARMIPSRSEKVLVPGIKGIRYDIRSPSRPIHRKALPF